MSNIENKNISLYKIIPDKLNNVYFMKYKDLIKIGESYDPNKRIKEIENQLKIVGIELIATTKDYFEKDIQYIFNEFNYSNEWFYCSKNILIFIEEIKKKTPNLIQKLIQNNIIDPLLEQDTRWNHMIKDVCKDDDKIIILPTPEEEFILLKSPLYRLNNALNGRTMVQCIKCFQFRSCIENSVCSICKSQFTQYINKNIKKYILDLKFNEALQFIDNMLIEAKKFKMIYQIIKLEKWINEIKNLKK